MKKLRLMMVTALVVLMAACGTTRTVPLTAGHRKWLTMHRC